jgi:hypothetical protein
VVTFNPSTLTLTKDSPSANFAISASAGALSASAKESVLVTYVLSGSLAATFTSLSAQDGILGERVEVLHRSSSSSSSGAVEAEAASGFVLALAATALVLPPPVLPSLYRASPSPPLTLRLSSLPPAGTTLTVTPACAAASAASSTTTTPSCTFTPAVLTFSPSNATLQQTFVVNGGGVGPLEVTYALSGTAAALFTVTTPPAGLGGGGGGGVGAGAATASWWSAEVHAAPLLRVTFKTESGNVPPLVPNAAGLQGGGGAAGAAGRLREGPRVRGATWRCTLTGQWRSRPRQSRGAPPRGPLQQRRTLQDTSRP